MRLTKLDGQFVRYLDATHFHMEGVSFADADGVMFLCPQCYAKNGGDVGTHSVLVWFAGRKAPPDVEPSPRWAVSGTGLDDLTLNPSINCPGDWHGWVRNGDAT